MAGCYSGNMTSLAPTALRLPVRTDVRRAMRLSEALPYFIDYRKGKGKSENTLLADGACVKRLIESIGDKKCSAVTEEDIDYFFSDAANRGITERTMNGYLRGLRMFWKWAQDRELRKGIPPTHDRELFKVPDKNKLYIPVSDFRNILDNASNPRDRMICALGLYFWQRQGEITTLRIRDVATREFMDDEGIMRRGGVVDVKVHKTKQADNSMPISSRLYDEFNGWRDASGIWHQGWFERYRADQGVDELDPDWYLTPLLRKGNFRLADGLGRTLPGRQLLIPSATPKKIHESAKIPLSILGYPTFQEGLHTLRRSGALAWFMKLRVKGTHEDAIRVVMSMLHHKDPRTTEIYLGVTADRTRRNMLIEGMDMFDEDVDAAEPAEETLSGVVDLGSWKARRA